MYWTLEPIAAPVAAATPEWAGRFVLHRHHDDAGPHLDLRLEHDGYCAGYRVDALSLSQAAHASEKAAHPLTWLERDGDALRVDAGHYAWAERHDDGGVLLLRGASQTTALRVRRTNGLAPACVAAIRDALDALRVTPADAVQLLQDGTTARQRAIGRFCGLGRELDGAAFDEVLWRETLAAQPLDAIHAHLRGYEQRFDARYPAEPVSQPAPLAEDEGVAGAHALALLRR